MSDNLQSTKSQLETLPNELFLEIFQYVDPIDLCRLKHLNKRINGIIQVTKVNLQVRHRKDDLDYLSSFNPSQIIRVEIRNRRLSLNLKAMVELPSVTLDCAYLSKRQQKQVISQKWVSKTTVKVVAEFDLCMISSIHGHGAVAPYSSACFPTISRQPLCLKKINKANVCYKLQG